MAELAIAKYHFKRPGSSVLEPPAEGIPELKRAYDHSFSEDHNPLGESFPKNAAASLHRD